MNNIFKKITTLVFIFTFSLSFSQGFTGYKKKNEVLSKEQIKKFRKKGFSINYFYNDYAVIYNRSKKGLIDKNGKIVISPSKYYLSDVSDKGTLITGEYIYGGNDGGGSAKIGLKNFKVISTTGKVIKETEFIGKTIQFTGNKSFFKLWNSNRKGTMINTNGDVLLKPIYDYLSRFNKVGEFVAFRGGKMDVFNYKGEQLNKTPLYYKNELLPSTRFPVSKEGDFNIVKVINKTIICSLDGVNYGVFDLKTDTQLSAFKYDKIDTKLTVVGNKRDTIGYTVYKNNKCTIIDYKNNKEIAPFVFESISGVVKFKEDKFISGIVKTVGVGSSITSWKNLLNIKTGKLIFSEDFKFYKAEPITSKLWKVKHFSPERYSLYDIEKKKSVFPIDSNISQISYLHPRYSLLVISYTKNGSITKALYDFKQEQFVIGKELDITDISRIHNNVVDVSKGEIRKLFNVNTLEFLNLEVSGERMEIPVVGRPTVIFTYYKSLLKDQTNTGVLKKYRTIIYDNNWNLLVDGINIYGINGQKGHLLFFENINGQKKYTAFDRNGKLIGKRREFNP